MISGSSVVMSLVSREQSGVDTDLQSKTNDSLESLRHFQTVFYNSHDKHSEQIANTRLHMHLRYLHHCFIVILSSIGNTKNERKLLSRRRCVCTTLKNSSNPLSALKIVWKLIRLFPTYFRAFKKITFSPSFSDFLPSFFVREKPPGESGRLCCRRRN